MKDSKVLMSIKNIEKLIKRYLLSNKYLLKEPPLEFKIGMVPGSTQAEIVDYIIEHNEDIIYQRDLENVLHFSKASISDVLRTMEKNDLIIRKIDPHDSRNKIIKLTPTAEEAYQQNKDVMEEIAKKIMKDITNEEKEMLMQVLDKIKKNIT